MMKAATGGQVQRVAYLYYDLQHVEVVRIEYEHAHGGGVRAVSYTHLDVYKRQTYTEEGTLAHRIGELLLRQRWEGVDITAELEHAQADPLYSGSMGEHMESYAAFIEERMAEARTRCEDPRIFIEQTVRFEEYVPCLLYTSRCV